MNLNEATKYIIGYIDGLVLAGDAGFDWINYLSKEHYVRIGNDWEAEIINTIYDDHPKHVSHKIKIYPVINGKVNWEEPALILFE